MFPLLVLYEIGLWIVPNTVRNGADIWLRQWLDLLGLNSYFFLPVLTVLILLGWHHLTHQPWKLSAGVLYGMFAESVILGAFLVFLAQLQTTLFGSLQIDFLSLAARLQFQALLGQTVEFFGAGVYEEVLFRLMLLPLIIWILKPWVATINIRLTLGILISSLLFSAAHNVGAHGDTFEINRFMFRFGAGVLFSGLFILRGFGITVGAHALYDIFVGLDISG